MANAMLSVMHTFGLEDMKTFGDSTGALSVQPLSGRCLDSEARGRASMADRSVAVTCAARVEAAATPASRGRRRIARRRRRDAARHGGGCAQLLKQGADVNAAQGDGMTALHWAALHGDARRGADAGLRRRARRRRRRVTATTRRCTSRPRPAARTVIRRCSKPARMRTRQTSSGGAHRAAPRGCARKPRRDRRAAGQGRDGRRARRRVGADAAHVGGSVQPRSTRCRR